MPQRYRTKRTWTALLTGLTLSLLAERHVEAADILVQIAELAPGATLHVALQAADAPTWEPALRVASGTGVTLRLVDVPPGQYALQLFADHNGNGQPDFSRRGIPQEPVGFSGNPPLLRGKPAPRHCSFVHGVTDTQLNIELRQARHAPSSDKPPTRPAAP